jgi:hypothetical protein
VCKVVQKEWILLLETKPFSWQLNFHFTTINHNYLWL